MGTGATRRIGLMGGTFDPIHIGHLLLGEAAYGELSLDKVLFMPTGVSYLKEDRHITDREDRFRMTSIAVEDNPHFGVSRIEVDRPGNTHTADTLRELCGSHPHCEWYLILGADSYMMLDKWVEPEVICELSTLVCAVRGECSEASLREQEGRLGRMFGARSLFLRLGRMDVSSTEVRERLRSGRSVRYQVPLGVVRYIEERGLYGVGGNA